MHRYNTRSKNRLLISEEEALAAAKTCLCEITLNSAPINYVYPTCSLSIENTVYYFPRMRFPQETIDIPFWQTHLLWMKPSFIYWGTQELNQGIQLEKNLTHPENSNKPTPEDLFRITFESVFQLFASKDYLQKTYGNPNKINFITPLAWSAAQDNMVRIYCPNREKMEAIFKNINEEISKKNIIFDPYCFQQHLGNRYFLIIKKDYLDKIYGLPKTLISKDDIFSFYSEHVFSTFSLTKDEKNYEENKSTLFSSSSSLVKKVVDENKKEYEGP